MCLASCECLPHVQLQLPTASCAHVPCMCSDTTAGLSTRSMEMCRSLHAAVLIIMQETTVVVTLSTFRQLMDELAEQKQTMEAITAFR